MRRARWVLVAAFALSILIHTVVATFLHPSRPRFPTRELVTTMRRTTILRATPSPIRKPPRRSTHVAAPHVVAAVVHPRAPFPAAGTTAPPAASGPPESPRPATGTRCPSADAFAGVVATPPPPQILPAVRALDVSGTAAIRVQLDPDGAVVDAAIVQSSGDASFDALAMGMARDARYAPARHACVAIASSYLFRVRFYAW
ncbi:MAG TPA: TonB family protein [Candidatus Tyrphobacter sp.]